MAWWNYLVSECHPCWSTWNRRGSQEDYQLLLPSVYTEASFSLKEAKCSSLIRALSRKPTPTFYILYYFFSSTGTMSSCQGYKQNSKQEWWEKEIWEEQVFFKKKKNTHTIMFWLEMTTLAIVLTRIKSKISKQMFSHLRSRASFVKSSVTSPVILSLKWVISSIIWAWSCTM